MVFQIQQLTTSHIAYKIICFLLHLFSLQITKDLIFENYKIIVVENNGKRDTFLDMLNCEVYYTENNFKQTGNKGVKELHDILDCIDKYNINDSDFIVKNDREIYSG